MLSFIPSVVLSGSLAIFAVLFGCSPADSRGDDTSNAAAPANSAAGLPTFALIELFTSEGCDSCPPADAYLAELAAKNKDSGRVLTIAYHVDYWDHIGWKDRFDDPAYSARQTDYAHAFRLDSIYTPQMIVNGKRQFVGSDRTAARDAIAAAQRETPRVSLTLTADQILPDKVGVSWKTAGIDDGETMHIVLIENGLTTSVHGGENNGRTLNHESVARAMKTERIRKDMSQGAAEIKLPADAKVDNVQVVAFVQRDSDMAVLGAARVTQIGSRPAK